MELARLRAERAIVAEPEQQPGLIVHALEKAIRAEESGKAAHQRMDEMRDQIGRVSDQVSNVAATVGQLREHVDTVVNEVKVEVGRQGVRVALIVAGISLLGMVAVSTIAGIIVYYVTH